VQTSLERTLSEVWAPHIVALHGASYVMVKKVVELNSTCPTAPVCLTCHTELQRSRTPKLSIKSLNISPLLDLPQLTWAEQVALSPCRNTAYCIRLNSMKGAKKGDPLGAQWASMRCVRVIWLGRSGPLASICARISGSHTGRSLRGHRTKHDFLSTRGAVFRSFSWALWLPLPMWL
jgi:hypothetical protein